ncbi:hypothetical protein [Rhizobium sp. SYY.PMSO]|uniref:hypothetical protein n=1 Tax=Rhizobium sp. SYY.PMSO TaxID=3382192 RepID=UPI0039901D85
MAGGERAPLAGLKVAEVESTKGDDTRSWGPPFVERHRRRGHCRSAGDIARAMKIEPESLPGLRTPIRFSRSPLALDKAGPALGNGARNFTTGDDRT